MIKRKILSLALTLAMVLMCFAGCGDKESFSKVLLPGEADLYFAPNVVVEETDGIPNLGGWTADDDVWWDMEIPADGDYTVRILYAMPGDFEPAEGWVAFIPDEGDSILEALVFEPTGDAGVWNGYRYAEISMKLKKGPVTLSVSANGLPEGQDNFINLRQVEVFSGEAPQTQKPTEAPEATKATKATEQPAEALSGVNGWWITPEDYEGEGLRLVEIFYADENAGTWTVYNEFGEAGDTREFTLEGSEFSMDMGFDMAVLLLDGDTLCNPEDGQVEFQHVQDPGFQGGELNFDGRWYRGGDPQGRCYEISGKDFQRLVPMGEDWAPELEGTFKMNKVHQFMDSRDLGEVFKLTTEDFGPSLVPMEDMTILFEEDGMDYHLYVRESALDPSMTNAYTMMDALMQMDLRGYPADGTTRILRFNPYCFYISTYVDDGSYGLEETGEKIFGSWHLTSGDYLTLEFEDGTVESVEIPEPEGTLPLDTVGCEFQLQPIF